MTPDEELSRVRNLLVREALLPDQGSTVEMTARLIVQCWNMRYVLDDLLDRYEREHGHAYPDRR